MGETCISLYKATQLCFLLCRDERCFLLHLAFETSHVSCPVAANTPLMQTENFSTDTQVKAPAAACCHMHLNRRLYVSITDLSHDSASVLCRSNRHQFVASITTATTWLLRLHKCSVLTRVWFTNGTQRSPGSGLHMEHREESKTSTCFQATQNWLIKRSQWQKKM